MLFWLINAIIFCVYSLWGLIEKKNNKYLMIAFVHLCTIATLRGAHVGSDTYRYTIDYLRIVDGVFNGSTIIEKNSVFYYYLRGVSLFLKKANGYMIATAFPTVSIVFYIIKKYSENYYASIVIFLSSYLYFFSFNASRQFLAIAITMLAFDFTQRKKIVSSLVLYFVAISIHNSTIVFGVFYIFHFIKWTIAKYMFMSIATAIATVLKNQFLSIFVTFFPKYRWIIKSSYLYKWSSGGKSSIILASYAALAVLLCLYWILSSNQIIVLIINNKRIECESTINKTQFLFELMAMMTVTFVINAFFPSIILFTRVSYTLFVYIIILLANTIENIKGYKYLLLALTLMPLIIYMIMKLNGNYSGVLEYYFFNG